MQGAGPAYRLELRYAEAATGKELPTAATFGNAEEAPNALLGYCTGFTQPFGPAHLESIQMRQFTGYHTRRRKGWSGRETRYEAAPRVERGLGLLLGAAVVCYMREVAPFKHPAMQLLAINDDERQHKTLVRYYRGLGFEAVREVSGDKLSSAADLMVWGGDGLLMEMPLERFLERWGGAVRRMGTRDQAKASTDAAPAGQS